MSIISKIIRVLTYITVALFPLFFLPLTSEYFLTSKLYALIFVTGILLILSTLEGVIHRSTTWKKHSIDMAMALIIIAAVISTVFASPNKISALLNINMGTAILVVGGMFFFIVSQHASLFSRKTFAKVLSVPAILIGLLSVFTAFNPLASLHIPVRFQFLQNQAFSPTGSLYDAIIFLLGSGIFIVLILGIPSHVEKNRYLKAFVFFTLVCIFVGLVARVYTVVANPTASYALLPPASISWLAALETLKTPQSILFGMGIDNFASVFTRAKDLTFNQSNLWTVSSFSVSRSAVLQIMTETGLLGLIGIGFFLFLFSKAAVKTFGKPGLALALFFILTFVLMPFSLVMWFLLLVAAALFVKPHGEIVISKPPDSEGFDFFLIVGIFIFVLSVVLTGAAYYVSGRAYMAEVAYQKAIVAATQNDFVNAYNGLQKSITLNPYNERARTDFSRLNMQFAINALVTKQQKNEQLTEQERMTVLQAIQTSISEAKAVVTLNQYKAVNWENLAIIYRAIINLAQGADTWTVSAYQRAIVLDPQNPSYRLNLGGIYYALGDFENALRMFEQAVSLKGNWPNAYYNLAWTHAQRREFQAAASIMQSVISLLDKDKDKVDYAKATAELNQFTDLYNQQKTPVPQPTQTPEKLSLPVQPTPKLSPKLSLPKEASPEAK